MQAGEVDISSREGLVNALFNHGLTPALAHGITDDELEAVYAQGYEDLEQGRFDEALGQLSFLVSQAPWDRRFQYSLGLCQQHRGEYAAAGSFYANAMMLDATDALSAFRMGECLAAQDDREAARDAFEAAITLSALGVDQQQVRGFAESALDQLAASGA
jgi:type III secretion system low calcium response chaperone LcrH/SycD